MRGWYRDAADNPPPPPPLCVYPWKPLQWSVQISTPTSRRWGDLFPLMCPPSLLIIKSQGKEDISEEVLQLRLHRSGGPSVIRAKHLRLGLCAAKREEHPNLGKWEKGFTIIQAAFRRGELMVTCASPTVLIIPKGGGTNFRVIGLVEVLWKAISGIINYRVSSSSHFYDDIYGFCAVIGMGTA